MGINILWASISKISIFTYLWDQFSDHTVPEIFYEHYMYDPNYYPLFIWGDCNNSLSNFFKKIKLINKLFNSVQPISRV